MQKHRCLFLIFYSNTSQGVSPQIARKFGDLMKLTAKKCAQKSFKDFGLVFLFSEQKFQVKIRPESGTENFVLVWSVDEGSKLENLHSLIENFCIRIFEEIFKFQIRNSNLKFEKIQDSKSAKSESFRVAAFHRIWQGRKIAAAEKIENPSGISFFDQEKSISDAILNSCKRPKMPAIVFNLEFEKICEESGKIMLSCIHGATEFRTLCSFLIEILPKLLNSLMPC